MYESFTLLDMCVSSVRRGGNLYNANTLQAALMSKKTRTHSGSIIFHDQMSTIVVFSKSRF